MMIKPSLHDAKEENTTFKAKINEATIKIENLLRNIHLIMANILK